MRLPKAWFAAGLFGLAQGQATALEWRFNQLGYEPDGSVRLLAVGTGAGQAGVMSLVDAESGSTLTRTAPVSMRRDGDSGMDVAEYRLELSGRSGRFRLKSANGTSPVITVVSGAYRDLMRLLLRSYYLQRCGIALNDPETGLMHGLDHDRDALLFRADTAFPQGHAMPVTGGWHDAGDYGKYVATTTVTLGRLLDAYIRSPKAYPDGQLAIPESGNRVPDLLDEAVWGLDWLLRMQRPDGAVYRKVSGARWPSAIPPEQDSQTRYVYGVSSADTARFAAVMAQAARVFEEVNPALALGYREAAERAWLWLDSRKQPLELDRQPEDDSGSGRYHYSETDREPSLLTDRDDRLWAAAELWLLTGESRYLAYVELETYFTRYPALFEWKNPALLGIVHLLRDGGGRLPEKLRVRMVRGVLERAGEARAHALASGFGLANDRFVWGSNKMTAEEGWLMVEAYLLTGDDGFLLAARMQRDFLLGINPQGISYVTGVGDQRVLKVAHLFARAAGRDIPGLMVGGPNDLAQDGIAPRGKGILSYLDHERAYSVNEYAIDYNASLIGLLASLETARERQEMGWNKGETR